MLGDAPRRVAPRLAISWARYTFPDIKSTPGMRYKFIDTDKLYASRCLAVPKMGATSATRRGRTPNHGS